MSDARAQLRERLRQGRLARDAALRASTRDHAVAPANAGGTFIVGARVFDIVSGEEGVIVGGTRENLVVPAPERRDG